MRPGNPFQPAGRAGFRPVRGPISGKRLFDYDAATGTLQFLRGGVVEQIRLTDLGAEVNPEVQNSKGGE